MSSARRSFMAWGVLVVSAFGSSACSGSSGSMLDSRPSSPAFADSGTDSVEGPAGDGGADAPTLPPASSGAPYEGRGDNFSPPETPPTPPDMGRSDNFSPPLSPDAGASDLDASPATVPSVDGSLASCVVTFTVTNALIDGVVFSNVVVGGDNLALGNWDPTLARNMAAVNGTNGTFTLGVQLTDGQTVHFKFGLRGNNQVTWETFAQNETRSLTVSCGIGAGPTYSGRFDVLPDGG
jgi:hypothetical protein